MGAMSAMMVLSVIGAPTPAGAIRTLASVPQREPFAPPSVVGTYETASPPSVSFTTDGLWLLTLANGTLYSQPAGGGRRVQLAQGVQSLTSVGLLYSYDPSLVGFVDGAGAAVVPVAGGAVRRLPALPPSATYAVVSPDAEYVYYLDFHPGSTTTRTGWRQAVAGGPPQKLWDADVVGIGGISADGLAAQISVAWSPGPTLATALLKPGAIPVVDDSLGGRPQGVSDFAPGSSYRLIELAPGPTTPTVLWTVGSDLVARRVTGSDAQPRRRVVVSSTQLLATESVGLTTRLRLFSMDTGESRIVVSRTANQIEGGASLEPLALTPAGRVVFLDKEGVHSILTDGSGQVDLGSSQGPYSISPNGRFVVYSLRTSDGYDLLRRTLEGSDGGVVVGSFSGIAQVTKWSADGSVAYVSAPGESGPALYAVAVADPIAVPPAPSLVTGTISVDGRRVVSITGNGPYQVAVRELTQPGTTRGSFFTALTPNRVLDTRQGNSIGFSGPKPGPNATISVPIRGRGGVPASADVSAVVLNVTAAEATGAGFVTVWPGGTTRPNASNLNLQQPGQTRANLVTVPIGPEGTVNVFTDGGAHLIADVAGYYRTAAVGGTATAGRFFPVVPTRVFDSRSGQRPAAGSVTRIGLLGRGGVPTAGVSAVAINVTATDTEGFGYVTTWPRGLALPNVSNLNIERPGQTVANQVIVPLGDEGMIDLYTYSGAHLIVDVAGWFSDASLGAGTSGLFQPIVPTRVLDTREAGRIGWPAPNGRPGAGRVVQLRPVNFGSGASAAVLNLTMTDTAGDGYVTAYPEGRYRPFASTVNSDRAGQTVANHATVATGSGAHEISLYTFAGTHLIADVVGTYTG